MIGANVPHIRGKPPTRSPARLARCPAGETRGRPRTALPRADSEVCGGLLKIRGEPGGEGACGVGEPFAWRSPTHNRRNRSTVGSFYGKLRKEGTILN